MKVHFLTPAYDGSCHVSMAWSLMLERDILREMGIESTWDFYPGCCYLDISRNMLIDKFLKGDCTHAFFIDSDVQWTPGAAYKILMRDKVFVCGVYPYKVDRVGFPTAYRKEEDGRPMVDHDTGLISVDMAPTGFMCLKRSVFDVMSDQFGDSLIVKDRKNPKDVIEYKAFFETSKIGDQVFGEDVFFCKRWREMDGDIWIEPDIKFWHHGLKAFDGNFHDYLRNLPGGGGPKEKEWNFDPRT